MIVDRLTHLAATNDEFCNGKEPKDEDDDTFEPYTVYTLRSYWDYDYDDDDDHNNWLGRNAFHFVTR